jgi:hypothetical protein
MLNRHSTLKKISWPKFIVALESKIEDLQVVLLLYSLDAFLYCGEFITAYIFG